MRLTVGVWYGRSLLEDDSWRPKRAGPFFGAGLSAPPLEKP